LKLRLDEKKEYFLLDPDLNPNLKILIETKNRLTLIKISIKIAQLLRIMINMKAPRHILDIIIWIALIILLVDRGGRGFLSFS